MEKENMNFENPNNLIVQIQLKDLEKNQIQIIKMLYQLIGNRQQNRIVDYLTLEEACEKYEVKARIIREKISLFQQVKKRNMDVIEIGDSKMYYEEDLREALLLNERTLRFQPRF
jgi:hypothetical protein